MYSTSASEVWITGGKGKAGRHVKEHGGEIGLSLAEGDDGVCWGGKGGDEDPGVQRLQPLCEDQARGEG